MQKGKDGSLRYKRRMKEGDIIERNLEFLICPRIRFHETRRVYRLTFKNICMKSLLHHFEFVRSFCRKIIEKQV